MTIIITDDFEKVILKDNATQQDLTPKTMAETIIFDDGEDLQFKYDNNKLVDFEFFENLNLVSPTFEVFEHTETTYSLKITDVNGYIITPNLIGPEGPAGDIIDTDGTIIKYAETYSKHFYVSDFTEAAENAYIMRIDRSEHKLGLNARIINILQYIDDETLVNVDYSYKRMVNGDILILSAKPYSGIIYLQGNNKGSSSIKEYTFNIVQSPHQTIYVDLGYEIHSNSFKIQHGTYWKAFVEAEAGYSAGTLSQVNGQADKDITLTVSEAIPDRYLFMIRQSEHQLISVQVGKVVYTNDFYITHGEKWTATIEADEGYIAGTLTASSGIAYGEVSISATEAMLNVYRFKVIQSAHQMITVTVGGQQYISDFNIQHGASWTAVIKADKGYLPGTLTATNGTATGNISVSASEATLKVYTFTIIQSPHQTITVTADGAKYTKIFNIKYGTPWTAKVEADEGWNAGALNISSGTITGNVTVKAGEATANTYRFKIVQSPHQTITVTTGDGESHTSDFNIQHATAWTATIKAETGYTAGEFSAKNGIAYGDVTVSATAATLNSYNFRITQTPHQTIIVTVNGQKYTNNFTISHGQLWTATVEAEEGWKAGTLSASSGIATGDVMLKVSAATEIFYTVQITQSPHQTITVNANGKDYTTTFTAKHGTNYTVSIIAEHGYKAGEIVVKK